MLNIERFEFFLRHLVGPMCLWRASVRTEGWSATEAVAVTARRGLLSPCWRAQISHGLPACSARCRLRGPRQSRSTVLGLFWLPLPAKLASILSLGCTRSSSETDRESGRVARPGPPCRLVSVPSMVLSEIPTSIFTHCNRRPLSELFRRAKNILSILCGFQT